MLLASVENKDFESRNVITVSDGNETSKKGERISPPPSTDKSVTYADIVRLGKQGKQNNAKNACLEPSTNAH